MSASKIHSQLPPSQDGKPPRRELERFHETGGPLPDFGERFSALHKLSSGGMSEVYLGLDNGSGRKVALKVASSSNTPLEFANRFIERESLALRKLRHPNIVSFFGRGQVEGRNYLALEFVEGRSVDELIRERAFSWPEAKEILGGLCDALGAVHDSGAVHADITANNVSISASGSGAGRPVLLDFGFVKFLDPELDKGRTPGEDVILGTFRYLAPEQVFRSPDFDHRADIYSLGVLAYRMLSGVYPFEGPSDYSILLKHRDELPRPLAGVMGIPPEADRIILRAMAKDPAERFQSVEEMKSELG